MKTTLECIYCKGPFYYSEGKYPIENPGPREIKPINCPYCGKEVTKKSTTTWWNTDKWSEKKIEEYNRNKSV